MSTGLIVKTGFNTKLVLNSQILGKRILAYFIDLLVMFLYVYLVIQMFRYFDVRLFDDYGDRFTLARALFSILLLPIMFYSLISEIASGGYTIGKFLMKIKVVKINGLQPGFVEFFIRWIFRAADIYFFIILAVVFDLDDQTTVPFMMISGLVALITISRSKNSQRLGDLVAGTSVIRAKQVQNINITILQNISEDYVPKYSQVLKLSDNDARIIKETFEVAIKNKDEKLIQRLVDKLEDVMKVKKTESNRDFVRKVLKDFNYYTQDM